MKESSEFEKRKAAIVEFNKVRLDPTFFIQSSLLYFLYLSFLHPSRSSSSLPFFFIPPFFIAHFIIPFFLVIISPLILFCPPSFFHSLSLFPLPFLSFIPSLSTFFIPLFSHTPSSLPLPPSSHLSSLPYLSHSTSSLSSSTPLRPSHFLPPPIFPPGLISRTLLRPSLLPHPFVPPTSSLLPSFLLALSLALYFVPLFSHTPLSLPLPPSSHLSSLPYLSHSTSSLSSSTPLRPSYFLPPPIFPPCLISRALLRPSLPPHPFVPPTSSLLPSFLPALSLALYFVPLFFHISSSPVSLSLSSAPPPLLSGC